MESITRYEDIDIDKTPIPEGLVLIEGKNLPNSCRIKGREVAFGRAYRIGRTESGNLNNITVGIVISKKDKTRFLALKNQSRTNLLKQK